MTGYSYTGYSHKGWARTPRPNSEVDVEKVMKYFAEARLQGRKVMLGEIFDLLGIDFIAVPPEQDNMYVDMKWAGRHYVSGTISDSTSISMGSTTGGGDMA